MGMFDSIAAHILNESGGCYCGECWWLTHSSHAAHLAAELTKAGYGSVQETKAEVWNEAYWTGVQDQMDAADHSSDDFGIPGGFPVRPARVNPYQIEAA